MFPLRDNIRSKSFPIITWSLVIVNVLVFLYESRLSSGELNRLIGEWGLTPVRLHLFAPQVLLSNPAPLGTLITAIFLHGGWFHLISNMWILVIFGDNIEDRMGKVKFLAFYLLSGIAANILQALFYPTSTVAVIGASGAIAGVLGAYFLFYPAAKVLTVIPIIVIPWIVEIPAIFYLGFWFLTQLYSGFFSLSLPAGATTGGVAWWAHIGGFLVGLFFARYFVVHEKRLSPWYPQE